MMAAVDEPSSLDDAIVRALLPTREPRGHKGTSGKLLIVAGSSTTSAPRCWPCAPRVEPAPGSCAWPCPAASSPWSPGASSKRSPSACRRRTSWARWTRPRPSTSCSTSTTTPLLIGPGLRPGLSTVDLVLDYLSAVGERTPAVVDAEGLNSLSTVEAWWERVGRPCVLTPHVGELTRLMAAAGDRFESIPDD